MNNAANQMAAVSAAMRMLLAGDPLIKPDDLLIAAVNEVTGSVVEFMVSHAMQGRSTFLAVFNVDEGTALLERVLICDGSTLAGEINIGAGSFIQKANGRFAIRSANRDAPYEYFFSRGGRRLARRGVADDSDRAAMKLRGLQALMVKAATPACRAEAHSASMTYC